DTGHHGQRRLLRNRGLRDGLRGRRSRRFRARFLHRLLARLGWVQLSQSLLRLPCQGLARISPQEFLEGLTRGGVIAEVFRVDLPNREQRLEAVLAARILAPQE